MNVEVLRRELEEARRELAHVRQEKVRLLNEEGWLEGRIDKIRESLARSEDSAPTA